MKLKRDIKLKDGRTFHKGDKASVNFIQRGFSHLLEVTVRGETFAIGAYKGGSTLTGFIKEPSIRTLEKWASDCGCESITGEWCESDGYGSDGSPSWLLVLGYI
jgi:hypothetical protein